MTKINSLPALLAAFRQHEAAYAAALKQSEDHPDLDKIATAENQCLSDAIGIPATTWPDILAKAELTAESVRNVLDQDEAMASLLADLRTFHAAETAAPEQIEALQRDVATGLDHADGEAVEPLQRAERALSLLFPSTST